MMFLDCPAYLDPGGTLRCGLPAEVRCRFTMRSTDGPVESAMIRCPAGHYFCGAIQSLTWDGKDKHHPRSATVTSRAGRDGVQGSHDGRHGGGGSHQADSPAEPERDACRPSTAPAYYLGHPAALWITAVRPRRRRTGSRYPMEAAVSGGNPIPCPPSTAATGADRTAARFLGLPRNSRWSATSRHRPGRSEAGPRTTAPRTEPRRTDD